MSVENLANSKSALCDLFKTDRHNLRLMLLTHFIKHHGASRLESFKEFCLVTGNANVNFLEFDFWINRFENGIFELHAADSEIPTAWRLNDMPIHVIRIIIEELKLEDQLTLRLVNRELRNIIDGKPIKCELLGIDSNSYNACGQLKINEFVQEYPNPKHYEHRGERLSEEDCKNKWIEVLRKMMSRVHLLLSHPNVQVKNIDLRSYTYDKEVDEMFSEMFLEALSSCKEKLSVETICITMTQHNQILKILPKLKGGTLKSIELRRRRFSHAKISLDCMTSSTQWNCTENLKISGVLDKFHFKLFTDFKNFDITSNISPAELMSFIKLLRMSPIFEKGIIRYGTRYFGVPFMLRRLAQYTPRNEIEPGVRHIPIEGSNDFLEVDISDKEIRFEKTL